ncbi:MAG TPA: ergothioneine biosynthesis protein EgtC [Kutzneria sp.]|nr:ergothioneine biosynthesis protein EgtC [Kutzneria sp.]
MCRHLGYLGPAVPLTELLLAPPHSLLHQSYAPQDMRHGGTINADGFGAGWFAPGEKSPVRYRRDVPMWTDTAFASLAGATTATAVVAAVRSATVGMPVVETASAPFAEGSWLFSHNGVVRGWPDSVSLLAQRLPVTDLLTLDAPTDAALLWALVRHRLRAGQEPVDAVEAVMLEVAAAAPDSRLNLLLGNDELLVATAWWHSLWVRPGPGAVTVASEPIDDDPAWVAVPDHSIVFASKTTVDIRPLDPGRQEP